MSRIGTLTRTLAISGLITSLTSQLAQAAPMAETQVRDMTGSWIARSGELQGLQISRLRPLAWESSQPIFYLAELGGRGWVLASADDALLPVIGWSEAPLTGGELPPALADWLKAAELETINLRATGDESGPARQAWQDLLGAGAPASNPLLTDSSDVPPLLAALWTQGTTYNESCPADAAGPGGHAFVGCVAVAMAQVMDYWNWPVQGTGTQSYTHTVYGPISVDFSQATYDWDAITPNAGNAAVRQLLYHAGVSVRMNYGPSLSTAQSSMIPNSMRTYFQYQSTTRMVWRSAYTAQSWRDMLHTELAAGRPVIYRGQGPSGGHAFDVDGVQDSTWFHVNWGWAGTYNGWFDLTDLSPGNFTFNDMQGAIIGIAPEGVAVNHQPVVPILYLQGQVNQPITTTLTGFDVDGDPLTFRVDGVELSGDVWTWTPPQNANGNFNFSYQACDASSCSSPASIVVAITGVNQPPSAATLTVTTPENEAVSVVLQGSDPDGDLLSYQVEGLPIVGNVWSWTPPLNASGAYTFSYQACDAGGCSMAADIHVTVDDINHLPIVSDLLVETIENQRVEVVLVGSDLDGDSLGFRVNDQVLPGHDWSWDPPANTHGVFNFSYQAFDGSGSSNPATLTVVVNHVNHLPVVADRQVETEEGQPVNVVLAGSDADGDTLGFQVEGTQLAGDEFSWTPEPDARGIFSFSYRACDADGCGQPATLTVVVLEVNQLPVASPLAFTGVVGQTMHMTLTASDADGDELSYRVNGTPLVGNQFSWTPDTAGSFTFTYEACDAIGCGAASTVTVTVASVNHLPVVVDRLVEAPAGQPLNLTLTGSDADGDALSFLVDGTALAGDVFSWIPETPGTFTFSYQACDALGCGAPATLTVLVSHVNQAPFAAPMTVEGLEDETLTITLAGFDAENDVLSYLVNGTELSGNQFSWTPAPNASGEFLFTYQVCDGQACSEVVALTVSILPVNDAPIARPVSAHLQTPGLQHIQLVAWDLDSDSLSYIVDGQVQDSSIFSMQIDETGPLSFSYVVTDGQAFSDTVSIELTFAPKEGQTGTVIEPSTGSTPMVEGLAQVEPTSTSLAPAYPNPFNPVTTIGFQLAATANVRLAIYNVLGQQVTVLVNGMMESGRHEVRWDGSGVASGAYLAVLQTPDGLQSQLLQLVK